MEIIRECLSVHLDHAETAFIFTNGHWIWPGVKPGHVQYTDEGIMLTTLSLRPLVFRASNFLTIEECDYIQQEALPHMKPSGTSKMVISAQFIFAYCLMFIHFTVTVVRAYCARLMSDVSILLYVA